MKINYVQDTVIYKYHCSVENPNFSLKIITPNVNNF